MKSRTAQSTRTRIAKRVRPKAKPAGSYHHGELKSALLDAAASVLADHGVEGFTLRECARRAGVSHGAPAHHFGDVRGLLSAFTAQSFEQLDALTREYQRKAPADGFSQLLASGAAYVDYALSERARFQLMFRSDRLDPSDKHLAQAGRAVFGILQESMARTSAEAGAAGVMLTEKTALAWSLVHGFATLMLENEGFASQTRGNRDKALALIRKLITLSRAAYESTGQRQLADTPGR
jgi:AcrR family transcriptional regulator